MNRIEQDLWIAIVLFGMAAITPLTALGQDAAPALVRSEMADWPQWRGPRRDGISEETGLLPSWPEGGPTRLWTAAGIGRGYSSCIVADQTIFITQSLGRKQLDRNIGLPFDDVLENGPGRPFLGTLP